MQAWQRDRLDAKVSGRLGLRVRGQVGQGKIVFGVLSDGLVARPGGVFLGLVKERERDIRPSFLGQTDFVGFSLDLAARNKSLRLWRVPPLARRSPAQLIELTDLRRFGDAVLHYAAQAHAVLLRPCPRRRRASCCLARLPSPSLDARTPLPAACHSCHSDALLCHLLQSTFLCASGMCQVNLRSVLVCACECVRMQVMSNGRAVEVGGKKVFVIFDTGTTGLTVTRQLYDSVQRDFQGAPSVLPLSALLVCACACAYAFVCACVCLGMRGGPSGAACTPLTGARCTARTGTHCSHLPPK